MNRSINNQNQKAFSLIEIMVVVAVIGILSSIGIVSYSRVRAGVRDTQRSSSIAVIAEALEKYYSNNGQYPSCSEMAQSSAVVAESVLGGINTNTLSTPSAADGVNSIQAACADLDGSDNFAYIGDGSAECLTGIACSTYTLKYREEATGEIKTVTSRHVASAYVFESMTPDGLSAVADSDTQVTVSWNALSGATNYKLQYSTSMIFANPITIDNIAATSKVVTGLTPLSTYYFRLYAVNSNSAVSNVSATVIQSTKFCPTGFVVVPGSATYGTNSFCVMKYEAKADDNGDGIGDTNQTTGYNTWPANTYPISANRKLVSSAAGYPVANISQTTATTAASSANFVYGCTSGCHIITEAEWMTIAQNVLSVPSNWSGGAVGSGYIYSGHNDDVPSTALVADASDANGYAGTGQSSPSGQRRTLTLTNGEVIWDLAGNVWEWTSGQMTGGQPTGMASWSWYQWTAISGGTFAVNPYPSGTGLSGSSSWNSTNGIGRIYGSTSDASLRGFTRGSDWGGGSSNGVLALNLLATPSSTNNAFGFRVAR